MINQIEIIKQNIFEEFCLYTKNNGNKLYKLNNKRREKREGNCNRKPKGRRWQNDHLRQPFFLRGCAGQKGSRG